MPSSWPSEARPHPSRGRSPNPQTRDGQAILALRGELAAFHKQHRHLPTAQVAALVEWWLDEQGLAVTQR